MTDTRVSDAELAALIAQVTGSTPEVVEQVVDEFVETTVVELLVSKLGAEPVNPARTTCRGCGETLTTRDAQYGTCSPCALKGTGDDLFGPATPPPAMGATLTLWPGEPAKTAPVPAPSTSATPQAPDGPPEPVPGPQPELVPEPTIPTETAATWDPPPSTVGELRSILIAYDASRPRSMQVRLGPSEIGTPCQQQMARKLAGAPRQPVNEPAWAPFQGTAVHAEMEKVVAFWNAQLGRERWLAEDELAVDEEIRGHGDAYDLDFDTVVDWKHVGTTALKELRAARRAGKLAAEQVKADYRVQAHLYGVGHQRKGRPVRFVRLVLLARSWKYDDSDEWTEEFQPEIAYAALDRYYGTQDLLSALDVAHNPDLIAIVPATPGEACGFCPFKRPGPNNWAGCPGNTEDKINKQVSGLIA